MRLRDFEFRNLLEAQRIPDGVSGWRDVFRLQSRDVCPGPMPHSTNAKRGREDALFGGAFQEGCDAGAFTCDQAFQGCGLSHWRPKGAHPSRGRWRRDLSDEKTILPYRERGLSGGLVHGPGLYTAGLQT